MKWNKLLAEQNMNCEGELGMSWRDFCRTREEGMF